MVVVLIHTGLDVLFMPLENAWELLAIWPTLQVYYFCDCWAYLSFVSVVRLPKLLIDSCLSTCCCIMFCCYCFSVVVLAVVS